ncbi:MAG: tyrosine-type recombinase/integrase [Vallitaleaceae bacterium]|jgi:integrase|nr:tyrosine-type recombinase/integrase [Vallitaleaceae bacterium]
MNGSVRRRGEKWYYSFDLAQVGGNRKRIERVGQLFSESETSVSDYLDYWMENYVHVSLRHNTIMYYTTIINKHIKPHIGKYRLSSITPGIIQGLINDKYSEGYSKSSLSNFMGVLTKSFSLAEYPYQFIKQDPTRLVKIPKMTQLPKVNDLKIISLEDYSRIIERFPTSSNYNLALQIAFHTGMRGGEVCAPEWENIDLISGVIWVRHTLINKANGITELGPPKTSSSNRDIKIGTELSTILKQANIMQKRNRLKYGQYYIDSNRVCVKESGEPLTTNSFKYLSRVINHELHIDFHSHSLRHTHATLLLEANINPKVIQERLGHSKIATTLDTYAHVTKKMESTAALAIDSIASSLM